MDILAVLVGLTLLLVIATWSSVRSYFARGRLAGMQEAAREIIKGIRSHYEVPGEPPPDHVMGAIEAVGASARGAFNEKDILRYHAKLRMPWALPAGARDIGAAVRRCCRGRTRSASTFRLRIWRSLRHSLISVSVG